MLLLNLLLASEVTVYFKNMRCGKCVAAISDILKKEKVESVSVSAKYKENQPKEEKIGKAVLVWNKPKEELCPLAKTIFDQKGYVLFWDFAQQNPCDLK